MTGLNDGKETRWMFAQRAQLHLETEGSLQETTQLEKVGTDKGERERKKEDGGPFKGSW